jgi:hypothetical protein
VDVGELRFTTTSLTAAPEIRLIFYTPLDDETRSAMGRLLGN